MDIVQSAGRRLDSELVVSVEDVGVRPERRLDCQLRCRQLGDRQADDEARITGSRLHGDLAVVRIDNDPAYDVETESSALAHLFGGKERIEDPRDQVGRDTRALIRDLDNYRVVRRGVSG